MKPGRVTRSAPAPTPARGGQETEEKLFSKLRREGTPGGRTGGPGRQRARPVGGDPVPLPADSRPVSKQQAPNTGCRAHRAGPSRESRRNSLQAGSLQGFLNSRHTRVQTRGALSCGFVAGCVLGFLNFWRAGWGGGGGRREGDWIRESLAQENPPPPPLCKFKQLSCLAQLRRQGLLLNLGAKGTDGAGGREGSPDGSLPLTPGPAVRI